MKKDLLKLIDLSREDIFTILDLADQLKYDVKHGIPHRKLEGKVLAMMFAKNSTRTRASFETGMFQLGGHAMYLTAADTRMGQGEPVKDTARTLSRYCDGIRVRTFDQRELEEISAYRDHLMEYLPLNLTEAEFAGKEGVVFRNTGDFEALNGKTYSDGWVWGADGAELTFRPDGAYDLLECKFVTRRDDEVEATGWFEVWCDGECVFTSEKLVHPQVDGQSVEVDITGCDELKLVFRCDYEVSTAESGYCYHGMGNPTLTKNIEEMMTEGE